MSSQLDHLVLPGPDTAARAAVVPTPRAVDPSREARSDDDRLRVTIAHVAERLAGTQIDDPGHERMLASIVAGVLEAVPHASAASITMRQAHGALSTHAPSDEVVGTVDRLQAENGEGPGVEVLDESGDGVAGASDLSLARSWPTFVPAALGAGFRSVLAVRLRGRGALGAVTLYGPSPQCFGRDELLVGALVGDLAAVGLSGARRAGELNRALSTRDVIGRAKGILMERFRIDDARAFTMLVESSQHTNMKLHHVATWLVDESEKQYAQGDSAGA